MVNILVPVSIMFHSDCSCLLVPFAFFPIFWTSFHVSYGLWWSWFVRLPESTSPLPEGKGYRPAPPPPPPPPTPQPMSVRPLRRTVRVPVALARPHTGADGYGRDNSTFSKGRTATNSLGAGALNLLSFSDWNQTSIRTGNLLEIVVEELSLFSISPQLPVLFSFHVHLLNARPRELNVIVSSR